MRLELCKHWVNYSNFIKHRDAKPVENVQFRILRISLILTMAEIIIHTWSELLVPLVNMIKEGCGNKSALLSF